MRIKNYMAVLLAVVVCCMNLNSANNVSAQEPVWDGNKVILVSEKLDDGVFAYYPSDAKELEKQGKPVATSSGFIVGEKGVLLIDTMLNKRLNKQVQKLVKKKAGEPIVYAVNSSFHG